MACLVRDLINILKKLLKVKYFIESSFRLLENTKMQLSGKQQQDTDDNEKEKTTQAEVGYSYFGQ